MKSLLSMPAMLALLGVPLCAQPPPQATSVGPVVQIPVTRVCFAQAFMRADKHAKARIEVAYSHDAETWLDGNFPSPSEVQYEATSGCGVCGSWDGKRIVVAYDDKKGLCLHPGELGGAGITWADRAAYLPFFDSRVDRGPVCAMLGNGLILVAVSSARVDARESYATTCIYYQDAAAPMDVAPIVLVDRQSPPSANTRCYWGPVIAGSGNTALMAWVDPDRDVMVSQGRMAATGPISHFSFDPTVRIPLAQDGVNPKAAGELALAADGGHWYLAVVQAPTPTLHAWDTRLYRSKGLEISSGWEAPGSVGLTTTNGSRPGLAGDRTGRRIAATQRPVHDASVEETRLFLNGSWRDANKGNWLEVPDVAPQRSYQLARFSQDQGPRATDDRALSRRP